MTAIRRSASLAPEAEEGHAGVRGRSHRLPDGTRRRAALHRLPRRRRPRDRGLPRAARCTARCSSRASRGSARPRSPRRWRRSLDAELIRLQCYEGIDAAQALYDWDFPRQLLHLRALEATGGAGRDGRRRGVPVRPALPGRPADAAGARRAPGRAARRRDRPGRRRVRGVPARGAHRARRDDPRAGHDPRRRPAARRAHLATAPARCTTRSSAAASTTGSTTRTSSARSRSCVAGCRRLTERLAARGRHRRPPAARGRPAQAARGRRVARLGAGPAARSAPATSTSTRAAATLGAVLKYREDPDRVRTRLESLLAS